MFMHSIPKRQSTIMAVTVNPESKKVGMLLFPIWLGIAYLELLFVGRVALRTANKLVYPSIIGATQCKCTKKVEIAKRFNNSSH